jgi:ferredoxin
MLLKATTQDKCGVRVVNATNIPRRNKGAMKATVDQDTCIGCALCAQICPEVFRMEGDKAVVFVPEVPPEAAATCQEAADACPVTAITITD